ncbi:MAG: PaaI family thioesterase, partial [Pseudomonadota bacterium]
GAPLIEMPFANKVQGRPGFLHGGAISGLLEMAAVAAIQHALHERGDEATFKQVNVTIDFMRGGVRQTTYAVGEVTRLGRTMANVEARAWQDDPAKPITIAYLHYLLKRS